MARSKASALRGLRRWSIREYYEWDNVSNRTNYNKPYYVFRPRGFDTKLMTIKKPDSISTHDFAQLMNTIRSLSETPEPAPRKRK